MRISKRTVQLGSIFCFLVLSFVNCGRFSGHPQDDSGKQKSFGTETGNPLASEAIANKACAILLLAHKELNISDCVAGIVNTSFSQSLGVPAKVMNPFKTLVMAESASKLNSAF